MTCFLESTPARPNFSISTCGSGSGCRPFLPVFGEMQEARARDMRRRVLGTAARRIGQIVAAIEHDPIGIVEALREDFGVDERGEDHAVILLAAGTEKI